jgi:hypothetical protein
MTKITYKTLMKDEDNREDILVLGRRRSQGRSNQVVERLGHGLIEEPIER